MPIMLSRCCDDSHTIQLTCIKSSYGTSEYFNLKSKHPLKDVCFLLSVIRSGFEPETHSLEGCCSIQLSYRTIISIIE